MLGHEHGDTLIEVIFSTAVLALIIVLSLGIMNAGSAQSERAVEGTFVRQSIDSQTELLRFARDAYVNHDLGADTLWKSIKAQRTDTVMNYDTLAADTSCKPPNGQGAFWLTTQSDAVVLKSPPTTPFTSPQTYATPGNGIWIEATPTTATNYVDFYIFACWSSPSSGPNATSGTVVRLYAPAS